MSETQVGATPKTNSGSSTPGALAPRPTHLVGVDLGGTKIHVAVADHTGRLLGETIAPTGAERGAQLAQRVRAITTDLLLQQQIDPGTIRAVGIGAAGAVDPGNRAFALAPNLGDLQGVNLANLLEEAFGCPVAIDNDVNLAAIGEWRHGLAQGASDFVFIAVGTGIGMGIIANGQLLRGARGAAGEIGFLPFGTDPLHAANQFRGPLEEALAGDAIARRYNDANGTVEETREVFKRAFSGDAAAERAVDGEAKYLAQAIVAVHAVLDPDLFILGGGIGSRPELLPLTLPWLERFGVQQLDVRTSQLGNSATVRGAIEIARVLDRDTTQPTSSASAPRNYPNNTPTQGIDDED
jgi:glucokinase